MVSRTPTVPPSKLKRARIDAGMTLAGLAEAAGTSKDYVWQLENKVDPQPTVGLAYRIAEALHTTVDELFNVSS